MRECRITCDRCRKVSGTLTPVRKINIAIGYTDYATRPNNNIIDVSKDLCGSCKSELKSHLEMFFKW